MGLFGRYIQLVFILWDSTMEILIVIIGLVLLIGVLLLVSWLDEPETEEEKYERQLYQKRYDEW